jgi:hypothetical protein
MREARSRSWKWVALRQAPPNKLARTNLASGGTFLGQAALNLTQTNASITCVRLPDSLSAKAVFRMADDSEVDGDMPVYQDLSEAAQSRLTSLHNLMTRSLIGL